MTHDEFLGYCREQLILSFRNTLSGKPDNVQKHRTEGLIQAAKLLGIASHSDISQIIEEEHLAVFGETVSERTARKKSLAELKEQSPDIYYDIPAIERL